MNIIYYIFDMDGTLFFTDKLNNESYNNALNKYNFKSISDCKRITRSVVKKYYPEIDHEVLLSIINYKQEYFCKNLDKIEKNIFLFEILIKLLPNRCVLWTSSDKIRAESIYKYFHLNSFFTKIIYSKKCNIKEDIKKICVNLHSSPKNLLFIENNKVIVEKLTNYHVANLLFNT